jgi:hypothetical protein
MEDRKRETSVLVLGTKLRPPERASDVALPERSDTPLPQPRESASGERSLRPNESESDWGAPASVRPWYWAVAPDRGDAEVRAKTQP